MRGTFIALLAVLVCALASAPRPAVADTVLITGASSGDAARRPRACPAISCGSISVSPTAAGEWSAFNSDPPPAAN